MTTAEEQYIEFSIANEKYAIHISDIHEIIKLQEITEIPNVKPYVRGVINMRGKIVPVLSLRHFFGREEDKYTKSTRIIVVNHKEDTVGIIVDQVNKVATFANIQPPPETVGGIDGDYFVGIGMGTESLVGILKMEQILVKEEESIGSK